MILEARLVRRGENWTRSDVLANVAWDDEQGVYVGSYEATRTGRHELVVLLHGVEIFLGTGYLGTEVITGDVSATACVASSLVVGDDAASVAAGDVATVTVHARDARGNALITGGSSFSVLARSATSRWRPRPSSIVATARTSRRWRPSSPGRTRWPSRAAASTSTGHRSRSRWFRVSRRRPRRTSRAALASSATNCALSAATLVAGEEASFRVVAKDAHNNTNDRTTEVGGDSFFYSVIGEGGYVKWAVASAASDGAPARTTVRFSRTSPARRRFASRSARRSCARRPSSCDRVFFHPRNPPSSRTACRTPSRARRTR